MRINARPKSGSAWSEAELNALRQLVQLELPMRTIARKLGRTEEAVRQKSHRLAIADMRAGLAEEKAKQRELARP